MALLQAHKCDWFDLMLRETSDFSTGWLLFASRFPVKVNRISGHESLFTDYQLDMWGYFPWINISSDNSYHLLVVYCQMHLKRVLPGVTVGYKGLDVVWNCPAIHLMAFLWRLFNYSNTLTCMSMYGGRWGWGHIGYIVCEAERPAWVIYRNILYWSYYIQGRMARLQGESICEWG